MTFTSILGQDTAVATLRRALRSGRVHHAYRFEGPDGVGKERTAFAFAQALVCTERGDGSDACGMCSACKRAVTTASAEPHVPVHPDVLVVGRGLYPAAAIGRSTEERQEISVDQVRKVVLARAAFPPHEGRARVVIVRAAEELSVSAANALLKTLEEPPPATHFVLLTSRGRELLDTIRSRAQLVRFAPLGDAVLKQILAARGVPKAAIDPAVDLAGGSAAAAILAADEDAWKKREEFVDAVLRATRAPDATAALAVANTRERDRDVLRDRLLALASAVAREARLRAADDPVASRRAAEQHVEVARALDELDRNASPALLIETMILRMRDAARPLIAPRPPPWVVR